MPTAVKFTQQVQAETLDERCLRLIGHGLATYHRLKTADVSKAYAPPSYEEVEELFHNDPVFNHAARCILNSLKSAHRAYDDKLQPAAVLSQSVDSLPDPISA